MEKMLTWKQLDVNLPPLKIMKNDYAMSFPGAALSRSKLAGQIPEN